MLETVWTLDPSDKMILEREFGPDCLKSTTFKISKAYETESSTWELDIDQTKVIDYLIATAGCSDQEKVLLEEHKSESTKLFKYLSGIETRSVSLEKLYKKLEGYRDQSINRKAIDLLFPRMPKFLYFSNYDLMSGDVSIEQLKSNVANKTTTPSDNVFLAFLEFAGTDLDELSNIQKFEDLRARVEAASIKITRQIFEYWSQNKHLKVQFSIDAGRPGDPAPFNTGTVMRARIENQLHQMTVSFNDRSAGFIWFFSFLVLFSQVKKQQGNVIILLDEPGLNLHAKAQGDLLRYIKDKLKPSHQVLYTTHSPFMVPPDNLSAVRTVEDVVRQIGQFDWETLGTKVGEDVLSTDRDTLFPLQGALGYEISQSFVIRQNTLLGEGPSDLLYIQAASNALKSLGRIGLDTRWTVCPSGGVDKISAFVSLFGGNRLNVAVLTDYAKGQKSKIETLKRSQLLNENQFYTVANFCGQEEADVEDLFDPALYLSLVNETYSLEPVQQLTLEKIEAVSSTSERIVQKVEALFCLMPSEIENFDHFAPSNWLIQNPDFFDQENPAVQATLNRWENLFKTFNAMLPAHRVESVVTTKP